MTLGVRHPVLYRVNPIFQVRKQAFRELEEMSRATLALRAGVWRWRVQERLLVSGGGEAPSQADQVALTLSALTSLLPRPGGRSLRFKGNLWSSRFLLLLTRP